MKKLGLFLALVASVAIFSGCESSSSSSGSGSVSAASAGSGGDDIDISTISWLGDNYSGAAITAKITGSTIGSDVLAVAYEPYSWPSQTIKVKVNAICCLFYERGGQITGGKFDFWRTGGQAVKILHNVHEGYQGHRFPASGTKTYTMNVSLDGSQRTNIKECTWR